MIAPAGGGRTIFVLPWLGQTLVGTTDNDYEGDIEHVQPAGEDVDYLLDALNAFFGTDAGPGDVAGAFAGVRPLISTGDPKKSVDISRKAELYETSSGMVTITGGKLTTWRRMAKLAVDRIVERDGRDAPCRTHEIPLGMAVDAAGLPRVEGVPEEAYAQLAGRYGYAARDVLLLAAERGELAQPVLARPPGPARRGRPRRPARAGAHRRRRAAAPHAARAHRRAGAVRAGRAGARARRRRDGGGARLGRRPRAPPRPPRSAPRRTAEGIVVAAAVSAPARVLRAGGRRSTLGGAPLLMGIVNATPDSFSDAGELPDVAGAGGAGARARRGRRARSSTSAASRRSAAAPPVPADEEARASCR